MANLFAETHEDNLFVPSWGNAGDTRSQIVTAPGGSPVEVENRVMRVTGQTTAPRRFPYTDLPGGQLELYGTFMWKWGQTIAGGLGDFVGPNTRDNVIIGGKPVVGASDTFFSINLFGNTSATPGLRMSMGDMFYDGSGGAGERFTFLVSNVLNKTDWFTIDWYVLIGPTTFFGNHPSTNAPIYQADVTGKFRVNCGAITTGSSAGGAGRARLYNAQPIDIGSLWIPDSPGAFEHYLDRIAWNNTVGNIDNTWICVGGFPGVGFSGQETEDVEIEIDIPWFRTHPLPIPTRGGFTIDDDAHRANARQLDAWANDPIEDFGEVIEVELGDDER